MVALGTGCVCGSTGGSQGKGILLLLTHSTSHSATTLCAPEPLPHVTWVGREVCEKTGNQRCSALSFACVVVEKGRTGYFLVSSMASSPFWKEAAQALCCPGLPHTGCRTTQSFLFAVSLRRHDGVVEQAQPCCSAWLHAVPRHFQTTCSPPRHPKHPSLSQASSEQQKVLPWSSGRGDKPSVPSQTAVPCLERCMGGAVTASSISFHPYAAAMGCGVPPSPLLSAALPGTEAVGEVQPHGWV